MGICQNNGLFGEKGVCTDRCKSDNCLDVLKTAVLAVGGQFVGPKDPLVPGPYRTNDLVHGCNTRDIYDPKQGEFLDPYTCPPDAGDYVAPKIGMRVNDIQC